MRKVRYSVAATLDGFIADADGGYDWIIMDDSIDFAAMFAEFDTFVMGRKTWESIRRPLPHRRNIVISGSPGFQPAGAMVVPSFGAAIDAARDLTQLFAIGGSRVFEAALPLTDRLELTRVHAQVPGDAYFPKVDLSEWKLVAEDRHPADEQHAYPFSFLTYDRRRGTLSFENRDEF